jgi:predicted nucleic acid-binding protein
LLGGEVQPVVAAQAIFEFWSVATRPVAANGLGWPVARARDELDAIRSRFRVLEEPPAVVDLWLDIVVAYDLKGKRIHDAHLLATMQANGVSQLLTCNPADFPAGTGISILTPEA